MSHPVRLMLDEDVDVVVAAILRSRGVDVVTVTQLGRTGLSDESQLEFASEVGQVLVTHNRRHFEALATQSFASSRQHAGIITGPQTRPAVELVRRILLAIDGRTQADFRDLFLYI